MAQIKKVLLLEDDPNLGLIIQESLERQNFAVTLLPNGEDGLAVFTSGDFDLCLVDVMMPLRDGFSFAREVRKNDQEVPIIFLTARAMTEDKITGFRIGCDDYVTKPFSMEELLLRIEAVLRRGRSLAEERKAPTEFYLGDYTFNHAKMTLHHHNEMKRLTDKESELLRLLCLHKERTLERSFALRTIWGDDSYHCGRSMDVFISRLRKYLKNDQRVTIKAVHGQGFRLMIND